MSPHKPRLPWVLAGLLSFLLLCANASACPNCKDSLASGNDPTAESLGTGLSYSVLFMLAVPFSALATGSFVVYRAAKRGDLPPL